MNGVLDVYEKYFENLKKPNCSTFEKKIYILV